MNRKIIIFISAAIVVLLAAALFWLFRQPQNGTAVIKSNGVIVKRIDLAAADDCSFDIDCDGGRNTVVIKNHAIYVSEATCPDKICINMGELKYASMPIICMPNRLEIYFEESGAGIDAVSK